MARFTLVDLSSKKNGSPRLRLQFLLSSDLGNSRIARTAQLTKYGSNKSKVWSSSLPISNYLYFFTRHPWKWKNFQASRMNVFTNCAQVSVQGPCFAIVSLAKRLMRLLREQKDMFSYLSGGFFCGLVKAKSDTSGEYPKKKPWRNWTPDLSYPKGESYHLTTGLVWVVIHSFISLLIASQSLGSFSCYWMFLSFNWIRRLTANRGIVGPSPSGDMFFRVSFFGRF